MTRVGMMTEMDWEVDDDVVNRDKNDDRQADGMNLKVDSKDEVVHI